MYQELYNFANPLKPKRPSLFFSVKYFPRDKSTYEVYYLEMIQEQKIPLRITQKTREKKVDAIFYTFLCSFERTFSLRSLKWLLGS